MSNDAQCEPWVNLNLPAIGEVNKAFHCLHLEVDSRVVEDVRSKVDHAFSALWAASQNEINESDQRTARLSDLLTKTANALRGEPEPLKLHGWADLPERALKMRQERDASVNAELRFESERDMVECKKDVIVDLKAQVEKLTKERDEALDGRAAVVTTANKACDQCQAAHDVVILRQERDEARSYGERLYQGALSRKVTCVYCGHEYPDGTPTSQDQQLTEHIKVCEKHPMRKLEQFKVLVHKQLDDWGVPTDPNPKIVCRVEARFAWLEDHVDFRGVKDA